jgi:hypothetical protein
VGSKAQRERHRQNCAKQFLGNSNRFRAPPCQPRAETEQGAPTLCGARKGYRKRLTSGVYHPPKGADRATALPTVLLVLVAETHRLGQQLARHSTSDRIPLHAGVPVVDTSEDTRVGNLCCSGGEARECSGVNLHNRNLG